MKELSIEQKAKAYDKKVSQAKEMLKDGTISQNTINYIQHLFPELVESEDKKWRSWLIGHLEGYKNTTTPQYSAACDEAIAWLEKQAKLVDEGEQKSAKNIVETWKDMRLEVYQQASGNRHEPNYSDNTTKIFSLNDIDEIIEKMSEQKSMDKVEPKFKVGDNIRKKTPSSCDKDMQVARIEKDYYICNHIGKFSSEVVPFSKEPSYELIEQKLVWSEEDEKEFAKILDHFDWYSNNGFSHPDCDRAQNWLISLRERIGG